MFRPVVAIIRFYHSTRLRLFYAVRVAACLTRRSQHQNPLLELLPGAILRPVDQNRTRDLLNKEHRFCPFGRICRYARTHLALYFQPSFYQQIGLKFEEETSEMLRLEHGSVWCWNLDALCNRSETPEKFWNVVLEEDGEDELDRSSEKWSVN